MDVAGPDTGDRSVKPLELFFDLVFVFAFTQVTQLLASELSWAGVGQGVLLIAALWLAWQSYATATHDAVSMGGVPLSQPSASSLAG